MCAIKLRNYVVLYFSSLLIGCGNTMYFYETEKISLTVEARPDSTQPVQGSLGVKQRVGLVVPKKKKDGEALSAISSFNFKITPESGTIFNPVLIQTAFITGEAAAKLNDKQTGSNAGDVAKAITLGGEEIPRMNEHVDCIVRNNTDQGTLSILKEIVGRDFGRLTDEDWGKLRATAQPCGVSDRQNYTLSLHKALQKKFN